MKDNAITVQALIDAPAGKVWQYWTEPKHITKWAFASDDWEARDAENDVHEGGAFKTVMASKDGTYSFDFKGTYTAIKKHELIEYDMSDGRHVRIMFKETEGGTLVTETFDPEEENPLQMQLEGWHAMLDNFKKYTEAN